MTKEARKFMEQKIGRRLIEGEVVHHIDGNPSNNCEGNLELCKNQSEHLKRFHRPPKLGIPHSEETKHKIALGILGTLGHGTTRSGFIGEALKRYFEGKK